MDSYNISQQHSLEVKTPDGLRIICVKNILYIEASRKCSIVYFDDRSSIVTFHMLKWFDNYLLVPYFFRCHNSYIVNSRFVDCYNHKEIHLKDRIKIPLSRNRIRSFKKNLEYFTAGLF